MKIRRSTEGLKLALQLNALKSSQVISCVNAELKTVSENTSIRAGVVSNLYINSDRSPACLTAHWA
jgi:hypothetical protein